MMHELIDFDISKQGRSDDSQLYKYIYTPCKYRYVRDEYFRILVVFSFLFFFPKGLLSLSLFR